MKYRSCLQTRRLVAVGAAAVVGLALNACSSAETTGGQGEPSHLAAVPELTKLLPPAIQRSGTLRVATDNSGAPPMQFTADDGKTLMGLEPELAQALADVLGVRIEWSRQAFDSIIPAIKADRADAAMASIGDLKVRVEQVDFVDYFKVGTGIAVRQGNPDHIGGLDSLCGHSVAVANGTLQEQQATEQSQKCKDAGNGQIAVNGFGDSNAARLALQAGRVDAWLGDNAPVTYFIKQSNGQFELAGSDIIALMGIAVNKDQPELRDALKAGLEELLKNGKYHDIAEQWGQSSNMVDKITINNSYL